MAKLKFGVDLSIDKKIEIAERRERRINNVLENSRQRYLSAMRSNCSSMGKVVIEGFNLGLIGDDDWQNLTGDTYIGVYEDEFYSDDWELVQEHDSRKDVLFVDPDKRITFDLVKRVMDGCTPDELKELGFNLPSFEYYQNRYATRAWVDTYWEHKMSEDITTDFSRMLQKEHPRLYKKYEDYRRK